MQCGSEEYNRGSSILSSLFGTLAAPSPNQWSSLNPDLMDKIYRLYLASGMLRTILNRLSQEVLRGGISVREVHGSQRRQQQPGAMATMRGQSKGTQRNKQPRGTANSSNGTKDRGNNKNKNENKNKNKNKKNNSSSHHDWSDVGISDAEKTHIETMLERAIMYGHLYGMIPVMHTDIVHNAGAQGTGSATSTTATDDSEQYQSEASSSAETVRSVGSSLCALEIPLPTSGHFIARSDAVGKVRVAWQWRSKRTGSQHCRPSKGVWVFVWKDQVPIPGSSTPFNSPIIPIFNDLMRLHDMINMDTQAYYEMTHPSMLMQEHPRANRDGADRQIYEFATEHFVADPEGDDMLGGGPGGTMVGKQRMLASDDSGAQTRANRSVRSAIESRQRSVQCRIDPVTGKFYNANHTVLYERGYFRIPSGMAAVSTYPRPTLRSDLLQIIEHTYRHVSNTFGVPPIFINSGSTDIAGVHKTSSVGSSNSAIANNSLMQTDASSENMRKTVVAVRTELSAMYAQAHYHLIWNMERLTLAEQLARSESAVHDMDQECDVLMERRLELLGTELAEAYREKRMAQVRDSGELIRAAQIADQASKLFRGDKLRQNIDSILGIVAGVTDGTLGFPGDMTLRGVAERERRGEGMQPVDDEGVLRDTDDIQGDLTQPPRRIRRAAKRESAKRAVRGKTNDDDDDDPSKKDKTTIARLEGERLEPVDPNELAEDPDARRSRIASEGRGVDGYTTIPAGPYTYQRRNLTEKPPSSISETLERAAEIVDRRLEILEETKRLDYMRSRLTPSTGRRGDTKIELVFNSLPVPNWPMLRGMVLDGILGPERYKEMVMTDLGLDPERDGPPPGVKPLGVAMDALKKDASERGRGNSSKPAATAVEKKRKRDNDEEEEGESTKAADDRKNKEKADDASSSSSSEKKTSKDVDREKDAKKGKKSEEDKDDDDDDDDEKNAEKESERKKRKKKK